MTIKLLRAKEDLHWEDKIYGEKPFCTKDTWYEVISSTEDDVTFRNDLGQYHTYPLFEVDKYFWTIDFEKGFEFINEQSNIVKVEDNLVKGVDWVQPLQPFEKVIYNNLLTSFLKMKKYSNQKETSPKKVKPSKEERPYENWKMSINQEKFKRCVWKPEIIYTEVEGLSGNLDPVNNIFYYSVNLGEFLSAKVYPFSYPDGTVGYEFVKENKDAKGYRPKSKPVTEDKYEFCPENIWDNFDWQNAPWENNSSCEDENASILDVVESTRKDILSSFGVPKDNLGQGDVYSTELKFNHPEYNIVEDSKSLEEEFKTEWSGTSEGIKSDGGKSDYYKIELPEWLLSKQSENGFIMLEDLAEVLFENDFNFTNVFKAQKRMYELKKGCGKAGNDFEYDAKKCKYYVDKQVEVEGRV